MTDYEAIKEKAGVVFDLTEARKREEAAIKAQEEAAKPWVDAWSGARNSSTEPPGVSSL